MTTTADGCSCSTNQDGDNNASLEGDEYMNVNIKKEVLSPQVCLNQDSSKGELNNIDSDKEKCNKRFFCTYKYSKEYL